MNKCEHVWYWDETEMRCCSKCNAIEVEEECAELKAQNEKLRKTLEELETDACLLSSHFAQKVKQICRKALRERE